MRIGDNQGRMPQAVEGTIKINKEQKATASVAQPEQETEYKLDISSESRQKAREAQKSKRMDLATLKEELKKAQEQGEAVAESMQERIRCLRIAMHIMSGDEVPREDLQYLAEKDPELFGKANMMRLEKEEPEKQERISEDEEKAMAEAEESGAAASAPADVAETPAAEASSEVEA